MVICEGALVEEMIDRFSWTCAEPTAWVRVEEPCFVGVRESVVRPRSGNHYFYVAWKHERVVSLGGERDSWLDFVQCSSCNCVVPICLPLLLDC